MSNQRERPGAGGTGAKKPFVSKNDERLIKNYLGAAHRSREVNRRRGKAYDAPWPLLDAAGFPVVHCECAPGDPPTLKFWCPYCGSVHIHRRRGRRRRHPPRRPLLVRGGPRGFRARLHLTTGQMGTRMNRQRRRAPNGRHECNGRDDRNGRHEEPRRS